MAYRNRNTSNRIPRGFPLQFPSAPTCRSSLFRQRLSTKSYSSRCSRHSAVTFTPATVASVEADTANTKHKQQSAERLKALRTRGIVRQMLQFAYLYGRLQFCLYTLTISSCKTKRHAINTVISYVHRIVFFFLKIHYMQSHS